VEPITKEEYFAKSKQIPPNLFAHNIQKNAVQNMDPQHQSTAKGVLGRVKDMLVSENYGSLKVKACPCVFVCDRGV
jgi:hypothetical protein